MKIVAVIMAGGKGERFWPKSRTDKPKQFLSLMNDSRTMIQKTIDRLDGIADRSDIFIITNEKYMEITMEQLPEIPPENIIAEPCARNTAPCIALAAGIIRKKYGDAVMLVLPSDHLIKSPEIFADTIHRAVAAAMEPHRLITIGITPIYPETGYGYIRISSSDSGMPGVFGVRQFVEKPDIARAKEYVSSGEYLWNSGMFVWKASEILLQMQALLPDIAAGTERIALEYGGSGFSRVMNEVYPGLPSESVDFGILERADNIFTVPGSFGWDDVGSWPAIGRINRTNDYGNVVKGDVISVDTRNSIIIGGKRLIATVDVSNLVIVDTEDALLICDRDSTQDIRRVIENLKICNRDELL